MLINKKKVESLRIVNIELFDSGNLFIDLQLEENHPEIKPGQFVEVKIENNSEVFLRRPFSIHNFCSDKLILTLWIKIVGKGTLTLSKLNVNNYLDIIYPLGNGFTIPETGNVLLVGGGCGAAPLLYLAKYLHQQGVRTTILIGAKTENEIFHKEKYEKFGQLFITTENGCEGEKGYVTESFLFKNKISEFSQIYACGPDPMMKSVAKLAIKNNIPCEISLENHMACGIGACLCCVVQTDEGHLCSCVDGPVFSSIKLSQWLNT